MKIRSLGTVLFGVLIVVIGLGFLFDTLGVIKFGQFAAMWWPLALIIVGSLSFLSNFRQFLWPLLLVTAGLLLQIHNFGWVQFDPWKLIWALAILFFGLSLLFLYSGRSKAHDTDDAKLDLFVAFSGQNTRSVSQQFALGRLTALFGGIVLDLNDAKLKEGGADIDVFTICGGMDIRVPEGWAVKVNGLPLFGGWDNKTHVPENAKSAPTLTVHGTCIFGGVGVRNGRPEKS